MRANLKHPQVVRLTICSHRKLSSRIYDFINSSKELNSITLSVFRVFYYVLLKFCTMPRNMVIHISNESQHNISGESGEFSIYFVFFLSLLCNVLFDFC